MASESSVRRRAAHPSNGSAEPAPTVTGLASPAEWSQAFGSAASWMSQVLGLGMDLQQQSMDRWAQRQREYVRHLSSPWSPVVWLDMSLAGMRWGFQEWDQATQDLMTASLLMRGDLGRERVDPLLHWYGQVMQQPWQAWAELWNAPGASGRS